MNEDWQKLLPLLVHIQANLDGDLSLAALSQNAGLSPSHLHRLFKAAIGETPRDYVMRLRVERGAFRLLLHDARLVDVALDCGFQNHETFIRAFRRVFGKTPSEHREWIRRQVFERNHQAREISAQVTSAFELSPTKIVRLRSMHLAFLRHIGPYESVPATLFDAIEQWAMKRRMPGPRVWLGIGHDAPITTPPEHLRFDAALVAPGPFEPDGQIGYQKLDGCERGALHDHLCIPLDEAHKSRFDLEKLVSVFPRQLAKHIGFGVPLERGQRFPRHAFAAHASRRRVVVLARAATGVA